MNTYTPEETEELVRQRDNLLASCEELLKAMIEYDMAAEEEPPYKHRQMMSRARAAIAATRGPQ